MENLTAWLIIIGLTLLAAYTMYVIKNEKQSYLETAINFDFHGIRFLIPLWWTQTATETDYAAFERKDTRYDWIAKFFFYVDESNAPIEELFKEKIKKLDLVFDQDTSVIYNPIHFQKNPYVQNKVLEIVRIEGTATEDGCERVYYDAILIRNLKTDECVYCSSRSSILNGGIEGPFFEEAIMNFEQL